MSLKNARRIMIEERKAVAKDRPDQTHYFLESGNKLLSIAYSIGSGEFFYLYIDRNNQAAQFYDEFREGEYCPKGPMIPFHIYKKLVLDVDKWWEGINRLKNMGEEEFEQLRLMYSLC